MDTQDVRALDPFGVHDGLDVVDPLLEGGQIPEAVGAGDAPLVELGHADVPADALACSALDLTLPGQLDVGNQPRNEGRSLKRATRNPRSGIVLMLTLSYPWRWAAVAAIRHTSLLQCRKDGLGLPFPCYS